MTDPLSAAISSVEVELTAEEWADALWLARHLPVSARAGPAEPGERPEAETAQTPAGPPSPGGRGGSDPRTPSAAVGDGATLHLPGQVAGGVRGDAGTVVSVPAVPALPDTLPLLRALRPLRMTRPSRRRQVVDEGATATLIADSSVWTPVMHPSSVRRFDLALVVDVSRSMVVWRRTIAELRTLMQHLGAFHAITIWQVDADQPGVPLRRDGSGPAGAVHAPGELTDPHNRTVVLVVTDCVGAGWRTGEMSTVLETWAAKDPVAILQVLPQRMWRRCGPPFEPVRLQTRRAGVANAELAVTTREALPIPAERGLVVPTLELDARWLEPWTRLIAGGADGLDAMALLTRDAPRVPGPEPDPGELTAMQRVYRFRNTASPVAFQLAAFLAATPLSLPVIRLVQNAMLPDSRPAHLAEFFLGDLIFLVEPTGNRPGDDPDDVSYEFHPGVRDLLLTRLRRSDTLRILHQVADYISVRFGAPRDFRAILAAEHGVGQTDLSVPFARVLRQALTALGGSYAAFAALMQPTPISTNSNGEIVELHAPTGDIDGEVSATAAAPSLRHGGAEPDLGGDVSPSTSAPGPDRSTERPPAVFEGVPTRNPHFTGREPLLVDLKARLSSAATVLVPQALHGLGGVGKTQLAVEYCHRYAHDYDLVLWIPAEQPILARATLAQLAPKLGLPRFEDQSQAVDAVLQALRRGEHFHRWLLVFDNADRPEDIHSLLPDIQGPSGHVLVTSRNQRWSDLAKILEVDVFTREESIDLLERRSPGISRVDADRLAEKLGDLPLALEQAAAWQAETGMAVDDYLMLLEERMEQLLDVMSLGNYPTSVAATWRIAFERLMDESPASLQLLELCAFFGAEPIAQMILPMGQYADSLSEQLRDTLADQISRARAIRHLGRYALAKVDPPTNSLQVHRLVQAVLREQVTDDQAARYRLAVQEMLARFNPGDPDSQDNWSRHAKIAPHVLASDAVDGSTKGIRKLVVDQVRYFQQRGYYRDSAELGELAYERWRADPRLGPDHEDTLICGRLLGISVRWLGETTRARQINEDTLRRQQRIFGEDHEHSLITANSLGADLRLAGEFAAARELGERTYAAQLRVFLEEDINTLQAANNRSVDLRLSGQFREATALDERTLASRQRVRGDAHPETLLSYMNLGCDHLYTGRYPEAKHALEQAIAGYERIFGPDHIPLLLSYRFLGAVLRRVGDFPGSFARAEANVRRYKERLGPDHVQTLTATMSLCNSMRALEQLARSAELSRDLLARYRDLVGESHPLTLACAANLAITLRQMGDLREARTLDEEAIRGFTAQLGKEHPSSLSVGNNLANDLYLAGEYEAALELSRTTLRRSREVRGDDNAYTLAAAANHVIDLRTAGQEAEARALEIDTWHRYRRLLGERHPDTIAATSTIRIDAEIDPPPY
jgi:tetratricopeptide (TPR) repeat protein